MRSSTRRPYRRPALSSGARWLALICLAMSTIACATRTAAPPAVTTPAFPDFVFPAAPPPLQQGPDAQRLDLGWRFLQAGSVARAEQTFAELSARRPDFHPVRTAQAYVSLAMKDFARAVVAFDAALALNPAYAPALVGKGQALLALERDADALAAFEAAHAADPSLELGGRIEVLTFRRVQGLIAAARTAAASGNVAAARADYEAALVASPESGFLHRELGGLDVRQGDTTSALAHFRRAVALDPFDAASWMQVGDILAGGQDVDGAREAYEAAAAADPSLDLRDRIAEMTERARLAAMPAEFRSIASAAQITRGDLAALIADRLGPVLDQAQVRQAVVTDTRGHWAVEPISRVVRAGVMDPFADHSFQPRRPVRRADLAAAAGRVVDLIALRDRALAARALARPAIADMNGSHLDYPAASRVVAVGVMPLVDGRFLPGRAVSGAEAIETVDALQRLASGPVPVGP